MANVFIDDSTMSAIGDAIRAKTGGTDLILPANMATEIESISTGSDITLLEEMEVLLDLSDGNQLLSVPDGYAVKSAIIEKPETLIPTNIAKGVDIAGVVGTLESGGGDEGWGLAIGGGAKNISGSIALQSYYGTYRWRETMPSEATDVCGYIEITATAIDETGAVIAENFETRKIAVNPADITYSSLSYGMKRATFCAEYFTYEGAEHLKGSFNRFFSYKLPNMKVEDNILYANADCTCGLYGTSSRESPLYLEGVDYRGSNITAISDYSFRGFTELKKVWLPEGLTEMGHDPFYDCTNLEEVHFTTATPPTVSSSMKPFATVPTTCKFYVPAGSLSAYTSAANYPSASTYTYIEE